MQDIAINDKDKIVMKLIHYFITDKGYNPVILHGVKNEIWLENLNSDYKIIRIVSNYIHNNEQLNMDIFRTKRVLKSIQRKTLSFNMDTLSIFIDLGENVKLDDINDMDLISIDTEKDIESSKILTNKFPDIKQKIKFDCDGMDLLVKLTSDINKNRESENTKIENIFQEKKAIIIPIILIINLILYLLLPRIDNPYMKNLLYDGNVYGLVIGLFSIFLIGSKVEGFYGKIKTILIYIFVYITSCLIAMKLNIPSGYIGASFGLIGALLNFGSYYRVYLTNILKTLIAPTIGINVLFIIFTQNYKLIIVSLVSLVAGFLISRALGVKYKQTKNDMINSIIMSIVLLVTLFIINIM